VTEATRHEALVNRAFAGAPVTALCLYDAEALDPSVLQAARQTHPVVIFGGQAHPSPRYPSPAAIPPECECPLPPPPARAASLAYSGDLRPARALVSGLAAQAGLPAGRTADLVLAVSELAANTLRHTRAAARCMSGTRPTRSSAKSGIRAISPIRSPGGAEAALAWGVTGSGSYTRSATWWNCEPVRPGRPCGCTCAGR
jgi:hypothetical protein